LIVGDLFHMGDVGGREQLRNIGGPGHFGWTVQCAVFEFYVQLRRRNQSKPSARRIAKLSGVRKQNRTHCIRVMIDATSTTAPRLSFINSKANRIAAQ
jgi:hypothetical protein